MDAEQGGWGKRYVEHINHYRRKIIWTKKKPSTSDVKASMNQGITTNELVALAPMMLERIMRKIIAK